MKAIAIGAATLFAAACLAQQEVPNKSAELPRAEMARRLASLETGMTVAQAIAICGPGRELRDETWKNRYRLEYGTVGDGSFGTLGAIYIVDGQVSSVRGGKGEVIDPTMFTEAALRNYLDALQGLAILEIACRPFKEIVWLPTTLKFVNSLRALGKVRALALVREYVRVRYDGGNVREWDHVRVVVRLLFRDRTRVEATIIPSIPRADDETILPHYPIIYLDGLPILAPLYLGFRSGGSYAFTELEKLVKEGDFVTDPISVPKNPFSAILKAVESPSWPSPAWYTVAKLYPQPVFEEDYAAFRDVMLCQVLSLCEGMAREFELEADHDAWLTTVRHFESAFEASGYAWDSAKCMYVLKQ